MGKFETRVAEDVIRASRDPRHQSGLAQGLGLLGGRVFFVLKAAATNFTQFVEDHPDYRSGDGVVTTAAVYTTVDAAIGACTAAQGDVIYVMPGHTETVTATSIAMDISGVSIICLGNGLNRPTFTYSAAAATITVSAANMSFIGGHHIANFADVTAAFTLTTAKDFVLQKNTFVDAGTDKNYFNIVLTTAGANTQDGLTVIENNWHNIDALAKAMVSILANIERFTFNDNNIQTGATGNIAYAITSSSFTMLNTQIKRNVLTAVGATGATAAIFMTGTGVSTGVVAFNLIASLDTTTELIFDVSMAFKYFENYYTGVADKSGYLVPAADSAA